MSILCTICFRAGSKGLKGKNFLKVKKKYLFCYTLDMAIKSKLFNQITVSTDSKKIINKIKSKYKNVFFIRRPKFLATDKANKMDVIRHALKFSEITYKTKYDFIFDLDATSALRNVNDLKRSFMLFKKKKSDNLFSVNESRKNPYFNIVERKGNLIKIVKKLKKYPTRRQEAPKTYDMNASIYIWRRKILLKSNKLFRKKTSMYIMDINRSIDVDSKFDLTIIKKLLK